MIQNLDVFLWNRKVGSLVTYKERYAEKVCFYFDRDFLDSGYDIAPLRASIYSDFVRKGLPVYAEDDKLFLCPDLKQNGRRNKKGNAFVNFCAPREIRRPEVYLFIYSSFLQRKDLAFPKFFQIHAPFSYIIFEIMFCQFL